LHHHRCWSFGISTIRVGEVWFGGVVIS
jgi:hypothetical protein